MPRSGRSGGGGGRRSASPQMSRAPAPAARAPVPHQPAPPQQMAGAGSQGPGLFGQMAATAGGVAIGSAVGHMVGGALMGGGRGHDEPAQQQQAGGQPVNYQQQQMQQPCEFEMRQFIECTQTQHDLSMCEGFNNVLKECRARYGGGIHDMPQDY